MRKSSSKKPQLKAASNRIDLDGVLEELCALNAAVNDMESAMEAMNAVASGEPDHVEVAWPWVFERAWDGFAALQNRMGALLKVVNATVNGGDGDNGSPLPTSPPRGPDKGPMPAAA